MESFRCFHDTLPPTMGLVLLLLLPRFIVKLHFEQFKGYQLFSVALNTNLKISHLFLVHLSHVGILAKRDKCKVF